MSHLGKGPVYDLRQTGQPLSHTILGPKKNILSIKHGDLASYIKTNYTADHMILIGASSIDHGKHIKAVEKEFGTLPILPNPIPLSCKAHPELDFAGLEVHVHDDDIPMAHNAVVIEGAIWSDSWEWNMDDLILKAAIWWVEHWVEHLGATEGYSEGCFAQP